MVISRYGQITFKHFQDNPTWAAAAGYDFNYFDCLSVACIATTNVANNIIDELKWFTEFGHLNRGDMLTSEQHRCHN
ncbi:hypothetical protein R9R02_01410, partial [Escherichia coli]